MFNDFDQLESLFNPSNFYSGENFNLFKKYGRQKSLLDFFQKQSIKIEIKDHSQRRNTNIENDKQTVNNSQFNLILLLYVSVIDDLLQTDYTIITILFLLVLISACLLLIYYSLYVKKIKNEPNLINLSLCDASNIQYIAKRNNKHIIVSLNEIKIGDILTICENAISFNSIITEGYANIYELSSSGEYIIDKKTIDNPFVLKCSYIIDGEGLIVCCSNPDKIPTNFVNKFKNIEFSIKTDDYSIIRLPNNFKTPNYDLKLICDYINNEDNWERIMEEDNCKIERKMINRTEIPLMRTIAKIENFNINQIFEAIINIDIRREWDKNFLIFDVVDSDSEKKIDILYMVLKSPSILFHPRDLVQRRQIFENFSKKGDKLILFKSIDHKSCPISSKYSRANTILSGYYITQTEDFPIKSMIYVVSQTDIGGSIPKLLVNAVSAKAPKDWVVNLIKGCEMVVESDKKNLLVNKSLD